MPLIQKILSRYAGKYASRWLVLFIDMCLVTIAYLIAWVVRFNFQIDQISLFEVTASFYFIAAIYLTFFFVFKSFVGVIRHTSMYDTIKIIQAASASAITAFIASFMYKLMVGENSYPIPSSIILIHALLSIFMLISARIVFKATFITIAGMGDGVKRNVLIYGAGQSGIITLNTLTQDSRSDVNVVGFVDDNNSKIGKTLAGIKIYSADEALNGMLDKRSISEVILSIQNISSSRKAEILNRCLEMNVQVKNVPPISRWINGELSSRQIKAVRIEDLLNREPIKLNQENIFNELTDKVIMITGAAGSIGSEIARQVVSYKPKMVLFVDQAETPMYELEINLRKRIERYHVMTKFIIADVSDLTAIERIFIEYHPTKVFHAAAYKHVPLMESNPHEAVRVNALGTKNMADLSMKHGVKKFVMVSTDKAVNPTNVMGATKRIAEMYIQCLNQLNNHQTAFITTRFGNVLGSNGSVIPLFKKQIDSGGPVTVTHPEITRYFMTIPEACQLVLEAGSMGKGGEIFIFDMGKSVKIIDVAKNMIKLSGLTLGKDIQIEITGLRPGEKLYEELLNDSENNLPTYNPKIKIANVQEHEHAYVMEEFVKLEEFCKANDHLLLVTQIKSMVKEYVSNNSIYETLD
jgi:FlaA1/EpsC-like NDP-sugar epimerase